jgi:hypothetical protein
MHVDDFFESKYLKAGHLKGKDVTLTISDVQAVTMPDDDGPKPELHFLKTDKTLVLNKTNTNTIAQLYGPEMANWRGRPITVFPTQCDYAGRQVECIRVRLARPLEDQVANSPTNPTPPAPEQIPSTPWRRTTDAPAPEQTPLAGTVDELHKQIRQEDIPF